MRAKFVYESIKHLKPRSEEELQKYYDSLDEVTKKIVNLRRLFSKTVSDKDFLGAVIWNNLSIKDRQYLLDKWALEGHWSYGSSNAKRRYERINNYYLQKNIIGLACSEYD